MCPVFTDLPLVKDGDEIGILNGGQAVGYDQHGPSFHQAVQRLLHQVLILSIQGTGCFIKEKNFGVLKKEK